MVTRSSRRSRGVAVCLAFVVLAVLHGPGQPAAIAATAAAEEPQVVRSMRIALSDGVELEMKLGGRGPLVGGELPARPVIAEFSPYGPGCCAEYGGPDYNYLQVHIRGTGDSDGTFDALGPRTQADLVEVLDWACTQPWHDGHAGLFGFSASAIAVYNSLHHELPCVDTAVLGSGTHELYRDLLYPGGIPNGLPAAGVLGLIGAPAVSAFPDRLGRDPLSLVPVALGLGSIAVDYNLHPTLDEFWRQRGFRGDANDLPILMVDGFFDVESRGAFQAFQALRDDGAHLLVVGAHDGVPVGSGGSDRHREQWYDRYLRGIDNGIDAEPAVQLFLADGDREDMLLAGDFVRVDGSDWPIPGTTWATLNLDPTSSGTATSINDGTLTLEEARSSVQSYPAVPSLPTATDPYNASILGIFNQSPTLTDMTLAEPFGLSYTTAPFTSDVLAAGPASLELVLSSTTPETDIFAVLSDVDPTGTAHPMAAGRLRSSFPHIDVTKSLVDDGGDVVQPYGDYSAKTPVDIGQEQRFHVEFWPIGNRFQAGHRLRLHILGISGASVPTPSAVNSVRLGPGASRLLFPVLPGSDLAGAIGPASAGDPSPPTTGTPVEEHDATPPTPTSGPATLPATGQDSIHLLIAATLLTIVALAVRSKIPDPASLSSGRRLVTRRRGA